MTKAKLPLFTIVASSIVALGGFLFGYCSSVISGAILFVSHQLNLTTFDQEMIVSILLIGALIGAFIGGTLADRFGRKYTMFITTFFFLLGTVFLFVGDSMTELLIGRFITGWGIGIASVVVPLYIAEISPPKHRGALVSLNQLAITIGILVAYLVDYLLANDALWHEMFGFGFIPAIFLFIGLFFVPETPSFLASKGKKEKAIKMFERFNLAYEEKEVFKETEKPKEIVRWSHLLDKAIRPALFIGLGLSIFQQITGINTVIYYAPRIFQFSGLTSATAATLATLGVGIINVIMTILALWLIDKLGRRILLIIGLIGMVISLGTLGLAFHLSSAHHISQEWVGIIAVATLMTYISFFAISLGPVAWLIISEIYPLGVRGRAMGIAIFANWVSNYFVSLTFLSLLEHLGTTGTFFLYAVIGLFALWFVLRRVPETKGKTFEEIQKFWKKEPKELI